MVGAAELVCQGARQAEAAAAAAVVAAVVLVAPGTGRGITDIHLTLHTQKITGKEGGRASA